MRHSRRSQHTGVTLDDVFAVGLALPDVNRATAWGSPALKRRDRLFACLAVNKSAEPRTLVAVVGFDERDELIAADPNTYYLTDHYRDHPSVLARLDRLHPDAVRGLLEMAWRFAGTGKRRPASKRQT